MAIKERKEREKQDMRNLIIDSATQLFLRQGYDKTSIRNIAEDIEYSPATIYLYFKDKDEIFYLIHRNGFHILDEYFHQNDSITDPFEKLHAIGRSYMRFAFENPDYYDLMFIMRAPLSQIKDDEKWKAAESAFGFLVDTITRCQDQKLIKPVDTMLLSMSVWSFVHGLVSLYIRGRMCIIPMPDDVLKQMLDSSLINFIENLRT
jgi:AcrR family transcriptional regulator